MAKKMQALSERAMLVDLTIKRWNPRRADKEATDQVIAANAMSAGTGTFWKRLMPHAPKELQVIDAKAAQIGQTHRTMTLPWLDGGVRCLTRDAFHKYADQMRNMRREYLDLVAVFAKNIDAHKQAAQKMLGARYNAEEYPTESALLAAYDIKFDFMPLADPSDFRVAIDADALNETASQYEAMVQTKVQDAMRDAFGRLHGAVQTFSERITRMHEARLEHEKKKDSGEKVGMVPTLRDSTIDAVREICDVLPLLNLNDDPDLNKLVDEVRERLACVEADDLRADAAVRVEAVANADDILAKLEAYL